jgi:hypothetical protein
LCMESVEESKKLKPPHHPGYFLQMRAVDGIEKTVHILINKEGMTEGFERMWEHNRLDLTIEAIIHDNQVLHPLFSQEELKKCEERLSQCDYFQET